MKLLKTLMVLILVMATSQSSWAGAPKTSAGLTLLEAPSARPAALGEAYSAVSDDIAGLAYNPASLAGLSGGQASFYFKKGLIDDSYGQLQAGKPFGFGTLGVSLGYYNGGDLALQDVTGPAQNVTAQKDFLLGLGYGRSFYGVDLGLSGKLLSSSLAEQANANAFAVDLGAQVPVHSRVRLGAALQNLGTELKYVNEGDKLPRLFRAGAEFLALTGPYPAKVMLEFPYYLNEKEVRPAVGLEIGHDPVALRFGYKTRNEQNSLSFGLGLGIQRITLDYAFSLVKDLDNEHKVSFTLKFGEPKQESASAPAPTSTAAAAVPSAQASDTTPLNE